MQCAEFRDAFEQYLDDMLDESSRESFRRHLRACQECRTWAIGVEPTLVFAATEAPGPDEDRVAMCTAAVMAQIRQQRLGRGLRPHRRRWLAAAAAVLVAVAGGAGWWLSKNDRPTSPAAAVEARDESDPDALPPRVQVNMPGEGIRVYQYADDENHNTAMYYIVNPALES